jgi:hypothetical protein
MQIKGERVRIPRWVHTEPCVVRVEVDAVIPASDPREPCLEPDTVRWLDEVHRMAEAKRFDDLMKIGDVYVRRSA